ncbi:MAG: right-handed parallel beta-helix repeat-containing protein [Candidatus Heimdallarchaeaceae archaeon]
MKKRVIIYFFTIILIITNVKYTIRAQEPKEVIRTKIEILCDEDFSKYNFKGNGSKNNPFLIEDLSISYFSDLIHIKNTTKYFIIQNNFLSSGKKAISIEKVANNTGKILNNSIQECEDIAINIENSNSIQIENNYIYYCLLGIKLFRAENCIIKNNKVFSSFSGFYDGGTGIYLYNCENVLISNNELKDNSDFGLVISTSSLIESISNEISNNLQGIFVSSSSFLVFEGNNCSHTSYGIFADKSFEIIVKKNFFLNNENFAVFLLNAYKVQVEKNYIQKGQIGLYNKESSEVNLTRNTIFKTKKSGIKLISSKSFKISENLINQNNVGIISNSTKNTIISKNSFILNQNYAIFLDEDSSNIVIYLNDFINNNLNGTSQAYDDGSNNKWHNENEKVGNYWYPSNSIGKNYKIDGKANSKDIYVLNEVVYSENTDLLLTKTSKIFSFIEPTILALLCLILERKRIKKIVIGNNK